MKITVEYPTTEDIIIKTEAEAKALGYKNAIISHVPINRPQRVTVKQVATKIKETFTSASELATEMCLSQTGMTPEAYQAKFNRAWNN